MRTNEITFENMDAREFMPTLPDGCADMVLTDPPYLVSKRTGFSSIGSKGVERFRLSMDFGEWDKVPNGEHVELLSTVFSECHRVLRDGGVAIIFYDLWKLESLVSILSDIGFRMFRVIEWIKTNPVPLNSKRLYLTNAREVAVVAVKGSNPMFKSEYHNGVFAQPIHRDGGKRIHPTQKPLSLMRELIELHTDIGQVVVDPFSGSGTTLLSALQTGRRSYGCERDKAYYDKAVERLEKYNGKS